MKRVSVEEFLDDFMHRRDFPIEWRKGQRLFNMLLQYHPDLAEYIRGTGRDPFHNDSKVHECLEFIRKNWNDF
jgi:hypothetical protein